MNTSLLCAAVLAWCFAGMTALSLAMDRHHEQLTGRAEPPAHQRRLLRMAGTALLAAPIWPCIGTWGVGVGLTAWFGWLTAAAMAVAWTLPYRPRWTAVAALLAAPAGLLAYGLA